MSDDLMCLLSQLSLLLGADLLLALSSSAKNTSELLPPERVNVLDQRAVNTKVYVLIEWQSKLTGKLSYCLR